MPGIFDYFPLSLSQRYIWNLEQVFSKTPINNISSILRVNGRLDIEKLAAAVNIFLSATAQCVLE